MMVLPDFLYLAPDSNKMFQVNVFRITLTLNAPILEEEKKLT